MIENCTTEPVASDTAHGNVLPQSGPPAQSTALGWQQGRYQSGTPALAASPASAAPTEPKKAVSGPAAGAVVGTSVIVLLVELARSGALEQYKDLLAPLIGWGPGLLIVAGFIWLAHSYAPPLIESQRSTATALQKLADTVEHNSGGQHDLVLAMQVNSDKLEQVRSSVTDLQQHFQQLKVNAEQIEQVRSSVTDLQQNFQQFKEDWLNAHKQ